MRDFKVKVCLTVDTEFSIGGAFADPARYQPVGEQRVWCNVGERSHGLGFLLDELQRHDLPATFFVESLHVAYFQNSTMPAIAREIAARGHAVELHAHPCWLTFRNKGWSQAASPQPLTDSFAHLDAESAAHMLRIGLDEIESWGVARPTILRTGNLHYSRATYEAAEAVGLSACSNMGLAIFAPSDGSPGYRSGLHRVGNMLESPVLTYRDHSLGAREADRLLTVNGTSTSEFEHLLDQAYEKRVPIVNILTHPFEFVRGQDVQCEKIKPYRLVQRRLRQLCRILAEQTDRFETVTLSDAIQACPKHLIGRDYSLSTTPMLSVLRAAANVTSQYVY